MSQTYVGIDVSKHQLDVALRDRPEEDDPPGSLPHRGGNNRRLGAALGPVPAGGRPRTNSSATCPTAPRTCPRTGWCGWPACAGRLSSASGMASNSLGWATTRAAAWQGGASPATHVMLAHFFVVRETLRLQKTTRPDRAPDLSAGGRDPAPCRFPGRPRPRPTPAKVLRAPVPAI